MTKGKINGDEFEAAKRSLVCELVEAEDTVKSAFKQAILAQFRRLDLDHSRYFLFGLLINF